LGSSSLVVKIIDKAKLTDFEVNRFARGIESDVEAIY